jgi:hypothetical protein
MHVGVLTTWQTLGGATADMTDATAVTTTKQLV